jgi:hypothetical protein
MPYIAKIVEDGKFWFTEPFSSSAEARAAGKALWFTNKFDVIEVMEDGIKDGIYEATGHVDADKLRGAYQYYIDAEQTLPRTLKRSDSDNKIRGLLEAHIRQYVSGAFELHKVEGPRMPQTDRWMVKLFDAKQEAAFVIAFPKAVKWTA